MTTLPHDRDIQERAFQFACRVVAVTEILIPRGGIAARIGYQLFDARTSLGANLEEASGAVSKREFIAKAGISLKEARESWFWLRLIAATMRSMPADVPAMRDESNELVSILTAILRNARSSPDRGLRAFCHHRAWRRATFCILPSAFYCRHSTFDRGPFSR